MENFLKKGNSKKQKNDKKEERKDKKSQENNNGLKKTDKFTNMIYLEKFTTPEMPAILSVGDKEKHNSMTIGWGSLGVAWKKPIFTVYVKPDTYTHEFMEKYDIFTVSFVKGNIYSNFILYGSISGRNFDKEKVSGTHIKFLDDGGITFDEAEEVFVCEMLGKAYIQDEDSYPGLKAFYKKQQKYFKTLKPHAIFIGEIIGHYVRK